MCGQNPLTASWDNPPPPPPRCDGTTIQFTCLGGVAAAPLGSAWSAGAAPAVVPAAATAVEPASAVEEASGWTAAAPLPLLFPFFSAGAWEGAALADTA